MKENMQANTEAIKRLMNENILYNLQANIKSLQEILPSNTSIPMPAYTVPSPSHFNMCSIEIRNTDCYYYDTIQDMGAHIPICKNSHCSDLPVCDNCKYYLDKSETDKIIESWCSDER